MFALFRTSTFRLAMVYLMLFAVSVFAVLGFVYLQTVVFVSRQIDETIDAEITGLAEQYHERGLGGLVSVIQQRAARTRGTTTLYLLTDRTHSPIAGNLTRWPDVTVDQDGWLRFPLQRAGSLVVGAAGQGTGDEAEHIVQAASFVLPGGYQLLVGRDTQERSDFDARMRQALGWSALLTVMLGLLGGVLLSRRLLARLEAINRTSSSIIAGDFSRRIPRHGSNDEFDHLAENLNGMLDRIERLMAAMRQVTDNIAHDLRSPLGRLRSRIEVTLLEEPSMERYRETLERTIADADGLLATFSALLDIAEAEAGSRQETRGPVDLGEIIVNLVDLYEPVAEEAGLRLTLTLDRPASTMATSPLIVSGNRHLLSQAIANLVENALKYTPSGGTVAITAGRSGDQVRLTVTDSGPGIPATERERVFDRFYRVESSRTTPGNGLGLSLVKAVISLHGGEVVLDDAQLRRAVDDGIPDEQPGPGLRATVTLPALASPARPSMGS
ncbi:MAG TPA: ATP-binding protein [Stellaceae bacterium]|nr:ATP-binding protein [Stellaceae bacterium]